MRQGWKIPKNPGHKVSAIGRHCFYPSRKTGGSALRSKGKFAVTGALAGLANGLFGSGGGLFLVPLLTGWAKLPQRKAFATSVAVILPLSLVSAGVYWLQGGLDTSAAWPYLLGGAAGGLLSGKIFQRVPVVWLRRAFGLLLLYGGVRAALAL